ncbi:gasdermin-E-like isoform X2 [Brachyhypopomus gauderio]|uniref:gasdermin-E-like isoform X2 n=1 Tax=Brachyhypopomus gauderio TaxID=698409 RepID=UPI0040410F36
MFAKVTHKLLKSIDPDGDLIAVSSLPQSANLKPLAVVIKRPSRLIWQKTKYRPIGLTLNDLLQEEPVQPELENSELVAYQEKHKGSMSGSVEAGRDAFTISASGSDESALNSPLGTLRKENVSLSKLVKDSKERTVDLHHPLLKQKTNLPKLKLTVVLERVFTTSNCTIKYNSIRKGSSKISLNHLKALNSLLGEMVLSFKQSGSLDVDTDVIMEIPSHTVLAYGVRELNIQNDSHYDISMYPEGLDADEFTESYSDDEVDGLLAAPEIQEGSSLSVLSSELEEVKSVLCVLTGLPHQSRSPLLLQLRQILMFPEHLSVLEDRLEELVYDDAPCLYHSSYSHSPHQLIDTFLDLLIQSDTTSETSLSTESTNPGASMRLSKQNQKVLVAMYNLVSSAMDLTDDGLLLLESFCSSQELNELNELVTLLTHHSQPLLLTDLPAPLQSEDLLRRVEQLFSSSNIVLKTEDGKLWTEITCSSEVLPYLLCIVIHGLAYLSEIQ